jgi:hypothetical protein
MLLLYATVVVVLNLAMLAAFFVCMRLGALQFFYSTFTFLAVAALYLLLRGRPKVESVPSDRLTIEAVSPPPAVCPAQTGGASPALPSFKSRRVKVAAALGAASLILLPSGYLLINAGRHYSEDFFLRRYAAEVPRALITGPRFNKLVRSTERTDSPTKRFRILFSTILASWQYRADAPGRDRFSNVEDTLADGYSGDCEDEAVLIVAVARALDLTAVVVLGETSDVKGHAWAEVLASDSPELPDDFRDRFESEFGNTAYLVERDNSWWIVCSPPHSLDTVSRRWWIGGDGQIHRFSDTRR